MSERKSFIIHKDSLSVLDELTDAQAGQLFKAIKSYQYGQDFELDNLLRIAFASFKNQFIRDSEKYAETVEARREAGSKGGKAKQHNLANASKCLQTVANVANLADSVSKSVSKSESDNNINNKTICTLVCKDGEFKATEEYVSSLIAAYPKLDVKSELAKMNIWLSANPKKHKTVKGMKTFITKWLNRAMPKIIIPSDEIAQAYNDCFASPLGLSDCEEMTEQRIKSAAMIWYRNTDGDNRTDSIDYFKNYFAYCATRDSLSKVINGYAPSIDRLLKYETYIKSIEGAYQCQQ